MKRQEMSRGVKRIEFPKQQFDVVLVKASESIKEAFNQKLIKPFLLLASGRYDFYFTGHFCLKECALDCVNTQESL